MFAPQASKIRSPSGASRITSAKSLMFVRESGGGDQRFKLQVAAESSRADYLITRNGAVAHRRLRCPVAMKSDEYGAKTS
jgi:hypothetical protein